MSYDGDIIGLLGTLDQPMLEMRRPIKTGAMAVASTLPEPEPRGRWLRRRAPVTLTRRDFSGAGMCGGVLAVATLYRGRDGALMIDPSLSETFSLEDREQAATEGFYHQLQLFFFNNSIKRVFVRGAVDKGPYESSRQGKIEGIIQLVDQLTVELVHPARLPPWLARERPDLPGLKRVMNASEKAAMKLAIEVAAFAESAGTDLSSAKVLRRLLGE